MAALSLVPAGASFDIAAEEQYRAARRAPSTERAYASHLRQFEAWCAERGVVAFPTAPRTLTAYVVEQVDRLKVGSVERHVDAIVVANREAGYQDPRDIRFREVWRGVRRTLGVAQHGVSPVTTAELVLMLGTLGDRCLDVRDRALLLLGFAGAFRRSEIVGLNVGDIETTSDGIIVTLRRSKTDQEGRGRKIGIPHGTNPRTDPVAAVEAWLALLGDVDADAPLFRPVDNGGRISDARLSDRAVARVVQRTAARAGLDPSRYAGHSLRAGFATSAAAAGASERSIMAQTGHKSLPMVRHYIRSASVWRENAATLLGL